MRAVLTTLLVLALAGFAHADDAGRIYQWVGSDGKVQYGDLPPQDARDIRPFSRRVGTQASTSAQAGASESSGPPPLAEADCAQKRQQLDAYANATRLVEKDSLGKERELTVAEREQLVQRTRSELETRCGDAPAE